MANGAVILPLSSHQCPNTTGVRKKMNLGIELDIVPHRRPLTNRLRFFLLLSNVKVGQNEVYSKGNVQMANNNTHILLSFHYSQLSLAKTALVRTPQKYGQRLKARQNIFSYREENVFSKSTSMVKGP